jgi:hypothetical protein
LCFSVSLLLFVFSLASTFSIIFSFSWSCFFFCVFLLCISFQANHMSDLNGHQNSQNGQKSTFQLKVGLAEMLKGGVIMDVANVEQAQIAERAGALCSNGARTRAKRYS